MHKNYFASGWIMFLGRFVESRSWFLGTFSLFSRHTVFLSLSHFQPLRLRKQQNAWDIKTVTYTISGQIILVILLTLAQSKIPLGFVFQIWASHNFPLIWLGTTQIICALSLSTYLLFRTMNIDAHFNISTMVRS